MCTMSDGMNDGLTSAVAEAVRQVLLESGALTHAFGQALADPSFSGLSSNRDIAVLTSLHLGGPRRPRDLRSRTGLTDGGLSNLFDRLEHQQLITRTYGDTDGDRRSALVSLTPRGASLVEAIADAIRRTLTEQSALLEQTRDLIDSISEPPASAATYDAALTPLEHLERFSRLGTDFEATMASHDPNEPTAAKATLVLCAAAAPDGTRPRDLLELADLSSGGITMLLDRLEDAGLIHRTTGREPDRRAVTVTLTDLGHRDLHVRLQHTVQHLAQIRSAVTVRETWSPP
jgi:DNA-binding MarR family transcriptional regulator